MTTTEKLSPAAQFFRDLAGEAYGERRTSLLDAYKDAVRDGKDVVPTPYAKPNEESPLRVYIAALLTKTKDIGGMTFPISTDELISYLPFLEDYGHSVNWDAFDDWLVLDGGWAVFRDICLDWEPQWFLDFLEREGYIDKGV